jgi:hypothetical protein
VEIPEPAYPRSGFEGASWCTSLEGELLHSQQQAPGLPWKLSPESFGGIWDRGHSHEFHCTDPAGLHTRTRGSPCLHASRKARRTIKAWADAATTPSWCFLRNLSLAIRVESAKVYLELTLHDSYSSPHIAAPPIFSGSAFSERLRPLKSRSPLLHSRRKICESWPARTCGAII